MTDFVVIVIIAALCGIGASSVLYLAITLLGGGS